MQKQMCSFLFSPANNHGIFCVTQTQLYRVGNWQFRYHYDIWKSLNVFWKILCDKASQMKIWDVLFSMLSFLRYFCLPYLTVSVWKMSYKSVNFVIFAKLSPSSSSSWTEVVLLSVLYQPPGIVPNLTLNVN